MNRLIDFMHSCVSNDFPMSKCTALVVKHTKTTKKHFDRVTFCSYEKGPAKSLPTRKNGGDRLTRSLGQSPINCCKFLLSNILHLIQVATLFRASVLTFVIQKCLVLAFNALFPHWAKS